MSCRLDGTSCRFLGGLVLTVDLATMVNKIQGTSGFELQVMLLGSLGVSGPGIFNLSCGK